MARSQSSAERRTKPIEMSRYGYRYTKDGIIPLTEDDLLHPKEGDYVVNHPPHSVDRSYLKFILDTRSPRGRRIFIAEDNLIDFQHSGVRTLSPDVAALEGIDAWDKSKTIRVADLNLRVLFTVEITSRSTRRTDFTKKLDRYYRAGVPLYILIDAPYGESKKPRGMLIHRAGSKSYELEDLGLDGRFWLSDFKIWLGLHDGRIACFDENRALIENAKQTAETAKREKARADEATARADKAVAQAEEERTLKEQEKARADALEARIRELEATAAKPQRKKKGPNGGR